MKTALRKTRKDRLRALLNRASKRRNGQIRGVNIRATDIPSEFVYHFKESSVEVKGSETGGKKTRRLDLVANTGIPMQVDGFKDPVIINLANATFDKNKTPILIDHETDKRIGVTVSQSIDAKKNLITAQATATASSKEAQELLDDAEGGFPLEASVGARITKGYRVDEGDKVEVNGREWEGPLIVADYSRIREISVTVFGADRNTSTKIAARSKSLKKGYTAMTFAEFLASLGLEEDTLTEVHKKNLQAHFKKMQDLEASAVKTKKSRKKVAAGNIDPDDDDDDDDGDDDAPARIKATAKSRKERLAEEADEEERKDGIKEIAAKYADEFPADTKIKASGKEFTLAAFKAHAIRDDWSKDAFELQLMRASRPNPSGKGPSGVLMISKDLSPKAVEASILRGAGVPEEQETNGQKWGLKHMYDSKELEASHAKQNDIGCSIQALMRLQIQAAGHYYTGHSFKSADFVAAAVKAWNDVQASGFSTLNITNILENVMHKSATAGFNGVETTWQQIAGRQPLNDFKVHSLYRLDWQGHFKKVAADGELKHVGMTDTKRTLQAETYGAMITIDRKTIRNDDLGLIVQKARSIGTLGNLRIDEAVYVTLLANAGSFFSVGNGNLITGAGSVLGFLGLENARLTFANLVLNGKPIGVTPSILLVGTNNQTLAGRLYTEERLAATGTADTIVFTNNPNQNLYRPVVSGYLNNTSITDQDGNAISGQSANHWYLLANPGSPQGSAIVIGFLDGRETPYFDEAETQFNIPGGIQMRGYFDFGVALHVPQLGLRAVGS